MKKIHKDYIDKVFLELNDTNIDKKKIKSYTKKRLKESKTPDGFDDPYQLLGIPSTFADEIRKNKKNLLKKSNNEANKNKGYEYKSSLKILGIPFIHINLKNNGVAKGFIAIGSIAFGLISLGGFSIGLLSLGGLSFGILLSIGGISSSIGLSIGGISCAYFVSIGAISYSVNIAAGAIALSKKVSIGKFTKGTIGIFSKGGNAIYSYNPYFISSKSLEQSILSIYPNFSGIFSWIINKLIYFMFFIV